MSGKHTLSQPSPPLIRFVSQSISTTPLVLHAFFFPFSESHYQADTSLPNQYPPVDQRGNEGEREGEGKPKKNKKWKDCLKLDDGMTAEEGR